MGKHVTSVKHRKTCKASRVGKHVTSAKHRKTCKVSHVWEKPVTSVKDRKTYKASHVSEKHVASAKVEKNLTTVTSVSVIIYHLITTDKCKLGNIREANSRTCRSKWIYVYFNEVTSDGP